MLQQKDMVESFTLDHEKFMTNLEESLNELDKDISEAKQIDSICTNEWCVAIERDIDDLHNSVYSISEPRFSSAEHSKKIRHLRERLHDLYEKYKGVKASASH
jgi:hypothetical protein